ncbi:DUF4389 domain-containing protein [Microbulbifer sp. SA54]|uniref:DUF4389 domain-containing protein n=1 Tax=Microbulbifer sp. SA54 TaxID=3401577 RepID=UPI003AAED064
MSNEELKQNLTSTNQWVRLVYMVLFAVLLEIAGFVMLAVVIAQFLFNIITGAANDNLRRLGDQLATYIYQTLQFLIYNTEEKPFPFAEWPESEVDDLSAYESAEEVDGEVIAEFEEVTESDIEVADEAETSDVIELGASDVTDEPAAKSAVDTAPEPKADTKADSKADSKADTKADTKPESVKADKGSAKGAPSEDTPADDANEKAPAKKAKSSKVSTDSTAKAGEADAEDAPEQSTNDK